jgi:hypothetical protein
MWFLLWSCDTCDDHVITIGAEEEEQEVLSVPPHIMKHAELLRLAPFVFPFVERVRFFRTLIAHDRGHVQGRHQDFLMGPSISLTIRRDHVYEDAFSELARDTGVREGGGGREEGGRMEGGREGRREGKRGEGREEGKGGGRRRMILMDFAVCRSSQEASCDVCECPRSE